MTNDSVHLFFLLIGVMGLIIYFPSLFVIVAAWLAITYIKKREGVYNVSTENEN